MDGWVVTKENQRENMDEKAMMKDLPRTCRRPRLECSDQGPRKKEVETNFPRRLHLHFLAFHSSAPVVDDSQARLGRRVPALVESSGGGVAHAEMGMALSSDVVATSTPLQQRGRTDAMRAYCWQCHSRSHVIFNLSLLSCRNLNLPISRNGLGWQRDRSKARRLPKCGMPPRLALRIQLHSTNTV